MPSNRYANAFARWAPPVLVPFGMFLAWAAGPAAYDFWVGNPNSIAENLQGLVLAAAIFTGLYALTRREAREHPGLRLWLAVWCAAVFYFLGEDLNWGQYLLNVQPSDFFLEHNKEAETNLHNMNTWFNQKPRIAVQLWVAVAGIIVPLGWTWLKRATSGFLPDILWPRRETIALALVTTIIPLLEPLTAFIIGQQTFSTIPVRFSEIQEFFFAWFMLLFAMDLSGRLRRPAEAADPQPSALRTRAK